MYVIMRLLTLLVFAIMFITNSCNQSKPPMLLEGRASVSSISRSGTNTKRGSYETTVEILPSYVVGDVNDIDVFYTVSRSGSDEKHIPVKERWTLIENDSDKIGYWKITWTDTSCPQIAILIYGKEHDVLPVELKH